MCVHTNSERREPRIYLIVKEQWRSAADILDKGGELRGKGRAGSFSDSRVPLEFETATPEAAVLLRSKEIELCWAYYRTLVV